MLLLNISGVANLGCRGLGLRGLRGWVARKARHGSRSPAKFLQQIGRIEMP